MPFLERAGGRIYYEKHGSGPALIFAHGLGGNHLSWWQQVPHFRERYTCVVFAHRGFWPSEDAPDGPGASAFVDDLAAVIDRLGLADVRLVAQSMGGWTCLGYALREPTRVRCLVMADTPGTLTLADAEAATMTRLDDHSAALFARGIHPAAGERMAREQPTLHFLYGEINALSPHLDKLALRAQLHARRDTPPEALAALPMPVLGIAGEEDIVIPPETVERLVSFVQNGRFESVPRAGHSVYFERPEAFNALLDDFLATVDRDRMRGDAAADG